MSRSYESRRRSEMMRAYRPTETPATEACTIFEQRWQRIDGGSMRVIQVLALDEEMALSMGVLRLERRYGLNAGEWQIARSRALERLSSIVTGILTNETQAESDLRESVFRERCEAEDRDPGGERLAS